MPVRMSQVPGKMKLELLPTFTALDRSNMTKRRAPSAPSLPQPPCFAPNVRGAHLDGEWTFRKGELPPYVMKRSLWPEMWQLPGADGGHYYGCRPLLPDFSGEHVWEPRGCHLRGFSVSKQAGCRLLRGRRITLAGDSTSLQLFLSLTFVLNGTITAWAHKGQQQLDRINREDPRHVVSFACGGTTRLEFFRNDYLLYSRSDERESAEPGSFNPSRPWTDFTSSAHHADLVLLGAGMHFNGGRSPASLYASVLNHTLASVQRARWLLHGHQPRTTFFMSPPKPVAACKDYNAPISLDEAVISDANSFQFSYQYAQLRRLHSVAEWLSAAHGASFLDSFSIGGRRPEATMGASMFRALQLHPNKAVEEFLFLQNLSGTLHLDEAHRAKVTRRMKDDCVHFCLPGSPPCIKPWTKTVHAIFIVILVALRINRRITSSRHALYCAGPTDTYARLFLGMLLDFDETSPLFAQRAATSWHAHEQALGRRQRQSLELRVARLSSLAWWPRPPTKKQKVCARPRASPPHPPPPLYRGTAWGATCSSKRGRPQARPVG